MREIQGIDNGIYKTVRDDQTLLADELTTLQRSTDDISVSGAHCVVIHNLVTWSRSLTRLRKTLRLLCYQTEVDRTTQILTDLEQNLQTEAQQVLDEGSQNNASNTCNYHSKNSIILTVDGSAVECMFAVFCCL